MDSKYGWRSISIEGLRLIGRGGKADVYLLGGDRVVKVFHDELSPELIEAEIRRSQAVCDCGLPAARVYEAVIAGNRYGIVSEYINGSQLGAAVAAAPDKLTAYSESMGRLLRRLHSTRPEKGALNDIKDRCAVWTDWLEERFITHDDAQMIRGILDAVPDTGTLLHCDFHPGNIMLRGGELIMIDLDDVCTGHPVFDLTLNFLLHRRTPPGMIEQAMSMSRELANDVRRVMLSAYFGEDPDGYEEELGLFGKLLMPLVMARSAIAWNITEEQAETAVAGAMPELRECAERIKLTAARFPAMSGAV